MLRTGLSSEHTQDPRTTSNIQDRLAFEEVGVVDDGRAVGSRAHGIFQHLFVDAWTTRSSNNQA